MATVETTKKIDPPVELPKCPHGTEPPTPEEYGLIITITVGSGFAKRKFQVYEGLLKHYSDYFRAVLSNRWPEGSLKTANLPDDDPDVFSAFFSWLSIRKLYSRLTPDGKIPSGEEMIARIYVFGDARGIPELCNAAIDLLFQKTSQAWEYPSPILHHIYDNTSDQSPLRKFMVDYGHQKYRFDDIKTNPELWPREFLLDLIDAFRLHQEKLTYQIMMPLGTYIHTRKLEICSKYHDHSAPSTSEVS